MHVKSISLGVQLQQLAMYYEPTAGHIDNRNTLNLKM